MDANAPQQASSCVHCFFLNLYLSAWSLHVSVFFDITHTTHYQYAQPVALGEHRVLFRPRDSHDLRVLATDMVVTPPPVDIRLYQDVYSNSVALVTPQSPASGSRRVRRVPTRTGGGSSSVREEHSARFAVPRQTRTSEIS